MRYDKYGLFKTKIIESEDFEEETEVTEFVRDVYLKLSEISDNKGTEEGITLKSKKFSALSMDLTLKEEDLILVEDIYYKINNRKIFRNKLILELTQK